MIDIKKGNLISAEQIVWKNQKKYLSDGQRWVEAQLEGDFHPGEKLSVVSVTEEKVVLTPYTELFCKNALQDFLKGWNLKPEPKTIKLFQIYLALEIPIEQNQFIQILKKIQALKIPEKLYPLAALKKGEIDSDRIKELETQPLNLDSLLQLFLNSSDSKAVFLPVDTEGSFIYLVPEQNQSQFYCLFDFERLDLIHVRGWIDRSGKFGEAVITLQPYADFGFLEPVLKQLRELFPKMRFSKKYFSVEPYRSVNGLF